MYLIFDTETTGLPRNLNAPLTDFNNWPRMVQIAWQLHDYAGSLIEAKNFIVKPDGYTIPFNAEKVHGISTAMANAYGTEINEVLGEFAVALQKTTHVAGHNVEFDLKIVGSEFLRNKLENDLEGKTVIDSMIESTEYCALPGGRGGGFKYPNLSELHKKLFGEEFKEAHNASADVVATARCFLELIRIGVIGEKQLRLERAILEDYISRYPDPVEPIKLEVISNKELSEKIEGRATEAETEAARDFSSEAEVTAPFTHLHVHSYYSVLNAVPPLDALVENAKKLGMKALGITDTGNLFGAYHFIDLAKKNDIKPIIGSELFMVKDRKKLKFTKDNPDRRHQQLFLAKNMNGYRNLSMLSSIGWTEGNYGGFPRIDREVLVKYRDDLITTTGWIYSEVNDLILNVGEQQAEEAFMWWKEHFGEDFYVQLNRHGMEEEHRTNQVLLRFAKKYDVKVIAANKVMYIEKDDHDLLDSLLCIKDNEYQSTPIGRGRGKRFGYEQKEFYLKSQGEMVKVFSDIPEAISNTQEIVDKIEPFSLKRDPVMPHFEIPQGFQGADDYLRHLTYEGARERYAEISDEIRERIDFELDTIKKMGYPGYFLIVQDFLQQARKMDVWVGPGRGSAAGSVVAYCLRITDVDPIKYDLLFERFLNPDRVSLPDIDIDFDEDGRERILDWVVKKYGEKRVAHIITFGKMAPKMAIRDVARVKQLPLSEANRLAKLIPAKPGTTFKKAYEEMPELLKEKNNAEDPKIGETLIAAEKLEGTVRNIGTHACGIIISKDDLQEHIPLSTARDADLLVTQFDGSHIEDAGMLKMDFLGLKTLSIIKDSVENIKKSKGKQVDINNIPHDDEKTFRLYSRGDTTGIFQFESDGMKKNLRLLKPNRFEDLIAMNALYRPGPMDYIPNYIKRKFGKEKIEYDISEMEEYLEETFGITVYQEQVMRLSQKLAGFSRGEADTLRKAMGKKKMHIINKMQPKFIDGAKEKGHDPKVLNKIWEDWKEFAKYAFNKSHSTCYAYVSYRMAWLKAHYPAEFMAALLSRNLNDISKITFFIDETRRMGIKVLRPDVNESELTFIVNKDGNIRFGMAAIKGLGSSVAEAIIAEREAKGPFKSIFDFAKRINLRAVNKRSFEALAMAGAFDSFENTHRAQFFYRENTDDSIFIEKVIRYATKYQERQNSQQVSLFGGSEEVEASDPPMPECRSWSKIEQLKNEKEVTGFYISGHPLDEYKLELKHFGRQKISDFKDNLKKFKGRSLVFGGMVVATQHRYTKDNRPWGTFTIEDFDDTYELRLFSEDYLKFKHFLTEGFFLLVHARVQQRYRSEDEFEVRVADIRLLPEVLEKQAKKISLRISVDDLEATLVDTLFDLAKKHKGECRLGFQIYDPAEKLNIEMNSGNHKVHPSLFLRAIEKMPEVEYKIVQ